MNHREGLDRRAWLNRQQGETGAKRECEKSLHEFRRKGTYRRRAQLEEISHELFSSDARRSGAVQPIKWREGLEPGAR
jgi:hypothetical protein